MDDKSFKDEIVQFSVTADAAILDPSHRPNVLPVLLRYVKGKAKCHDYILCMICIVFIYSHCKLLKSWDQTSRSDRWDCLSRHYNITSVALPLSNRSLGRKSVGRTVMLLNGLFIKGHFVDDYVVKAL